MFGCGGWAGSLYDGLDNSTNGKHVEMPGVLVRVVCVLNTNNTHMHAYTRAYTRESEPNEEQNTILTLLLRYAVLSLSPPIACLLLQLGSFKEPVCTSHQPTYGMLDLKSPHRPALHRSASLTPSSAHLTLLSTIHHLLRNLHHDHRLHRHESFHRYALPRIDRTTLKLSLWRPREPTFLG